MTRKDQFRKNPLCSGYASSQATIVNGLDMRLLVGSLRLEGACAWGGHGQYTTADVGALTFTMVAWLLAYPEQRGFFRN
jgi:hypothetical protein